MTFKKIHMCLSVRGALNWPKGELRRATKWILKPDGSKFTLEELRNALMDELVKGHEVIPINRCDNFDYKKGCLGHPDDPKS